MNIWHKRFLYLQIAVLLCIAFLYWFFPDHQQLIIAGSTLFFFLEFGTLEAQRNENPSAVFYKKSCLFAMIDLISVGWFMTHFVLMMLNYFSDRFSYSGKFALILLLYIAIRKFYILKNYSYEK